MLFVTNLYYARTALSNSAILDEFSEQHKHQSIKKAPYLSNLQLALFFGENEVQINCTFYLEYKLGYVKKIY